MSSDTPASPLIPYNNILGAELSRKPLICPAAATDWNISRSTGLMGSAASVGYTCSMGPQWANGSSGSTNKVHGGGTGQAWGAARLLRWTCLETMHVKVRRQRRQEREPGNVASGKAAPKPARSRALAAKQNRSLECLSVGAALNTARSGCDVGRDLEQKWLEPLQSRSLTLWTLPDSPLCSRKLAV